MKDEAFERWAESRHGEMDKERKAMKAIVCSRPELRKLKSVNKEVSVPLGQVRVCEGVWKTLWLKP